MTRTRISSTHLARSLGEILGRLRYGGESFIIEKSGKPVALLSAYPSHVRHTWPQFVEAWFQAGARDEDLALLLEEVDRSDRPAIDPWASR